MAEKKRQKQLEKERYERMDYEDERKVSHMREGDKGSDRENTLVGGVEDGIKGDSFSGLTDAVKGAAAYKPGTLQKMNNLKSQMHMTEEVKKINCSVSGI